MSGVNYLAHIFLSGTGGMMQVGGFIADAVKGASHRKYHPAIADGILLHRAIDAFTDGHPAVKEALRKMKPRFGRYSGVLLDIYFDYLLASRFREFSRVPLRRFTRRFYFNLILNRRRLPARIKNFMWHFVGTDRLGRYASTSGIRESLGIMVKYRHIKISADEAVEYLSTHEKELWDVFMSFFPELKVVCDGYILAPDRAEYLKRHNETLSQTPHAD